MHCLCGAWSKESGFVQIVQQDTWRQGKTAQFKVPLLQFIKEGEGINWGVSGY